MPLSVSEGAIPYMPLSVSKRVLPFLSILPSGGAYCKQNEQRRRKNAVGACTRPR